MNFTFDGQAHDLGKQGGGMTGYRMGYRGGDLEGLKKFVLDKASGVGEVVGVPSTEAHGDGTYTVSVFVRSKKGIV